MSEHTKEPWYYQEGYNNVYALSGGDIGITQHIAKMNAAQLDHGHNEAGANARRIVACVNACKGIETETLEAPGSIAEIIRGHRENEAALRARAEKAEELVKIYEDGSKATETRLLKAEAEAKQLREELSHSILEATAQLVNAKADALARAEKAEAWSIEIRQAAHALLEVLPSCRCHEAYRDRGLVDPDCEAHDFEPEASRLRAILAGKGE